MGNVLIMHCSMPSRTITLESVFPTMMSAVVISTRPFPLLVLPKHPVRSPEYPYHLNTPFHILFYIGFLYQLQKPSHFCYHSRTVSTLFVIFCLSFLYVYRLRSPSHCLFDPFYFGDWAHIPLSFDLVSPLSVPCSY